MLLNLTSLGALNSIWRLTCRLHNTMWCWWIGWTSFRQMMHSMIVGPPELAAKNDISERFKLVVGQEESLLGHHMRVYLFFHKEAPPQQPGWVTPSTLLKGSHGRSVSASFCLGDELHRWEGLSAERWCMVFATWPVACCWRKTGANALFDQWCADLALNSVDHTQTNLQVINPVWSFFQRMYTFQKGHTVYCMNCQNFYIAWRLYYSWMLNNMSSIITFMSNFTWDYITAGAFVCHCSLFLLYLYHIVTKGRNAEAISSGIEDE